MSAAGPTRRPGRALTRLGAAVLIALAAFWFWPRAAPIGVTARLLADSRPPVFDPDTLLESTIVAGWDFEGAAGLAGWSIEGSRGIVPLPVAGAARGPGGLRLGPSVASGWLHHRLPDVRPDGVSLAATGWFAGDLVTFCWASAREAFVADRCVYRRYQPDDGGRMQFVFEPDRRPPASADRLQLQLTTERNHPVVLEAVELFRLGLGSGRSLEGVWKVDLNQERRPAVLSPLPEGDAAIGGLTEVPFRATLHLAVGLIAGAPRDIHVAVLADRGDGPAIAAETVVPSVGAGQGAWHSVSLPLPSLAGLSVRLSLRARDDAGAPGLLAWGSPVLTGRLPAQQPKRPNVILISADTVRADRLSVHGYERDTTPHLAAWAARRGVVFEHAIAAAPWTLPAHVSMLSGRHAFNHGVNRQGPIPGTLPMVAEAFAAAGYRTWAATAGALLVPDYGFDRGFDRYAVHTDLRRIGTDELDAKQGVDRLLAWLGGRGDAPFFAFLHTYGAHTPFDPGPGLRSKFVEPGADDGSVESVDLDPNAPDEHGGVSYGFRAYARNEHEQIVATRRLTPTDRALVGQLYDAGLASLDAELGRLLEALETTGLADETVVIITSDHGESLYERDLAGHYHLFEENIHIPLIVAAPGVEPHRVSTQVATVDVVPTLLDLAGLAPWPDIDGRSLRPLAEGRARDSVAAYTYASMTSHGLSIRHGDGRKTVVRDSIWHGRSPALRFDLLRDPDELSPMELDADDVEEARVVADVAGVVIEVENQAAAPMVLAVADAEPIRIATTSTRLPEGCCPYRPGAFEVMVPAGQGLHLTVQDPPPNWTASLSLSFADSMRAYERRVELTPGFQDFAVELREGEWMPTDPRLAPRTGLRLRYLSDRPLDPERNRIAVPDHLRALGYIR